MFGSFRKFGKLGSSPGSKSAAVMPSGAIGIWYADQYQSSPSRYIPNAVNPVAPIGYFHGIRRTLSVVNRTLWDASDCTVVENAAVGPDGSTQDAATISGTGTSWAFGKASIVLPAGTYTVVPVVKRNAGSDQEFVSRVSSQISAKRVATASWQRFPFTFTTGGGSVNVYALWSASAGTPAGATDANLQVHEVNLYSGAADLGSDALVGNMVLGFSGGSTLPSVSGNLVDLSAGSDSFATIQFDEAKVFQNAMTYIVVAQQVTNTNSYPSLLHAFNSGGDFNELNAWMAYNSETLEWRYKGNQAYVQREPSLLFNGKGLHGFTFRYDGSSMDTFVDDVIFSKKAASSLGTVTTKDFYVGLWGGARSNHKLFAAALYNRALSDAEVRAAYAALKLRAESLALTVTPMSRVIVAEGDSITAPYISGALQSYAYKYGANASPFAYTIVRAISGDAVAQLQARAADIDAIIPPAKAGRKFILSVLCGANDFDDGLTTTQFLTAYASYLDARRAAGFPVAVGTILPRTAVGFNAWRNTCNTEIRLWATGGSAVPGIHADAIIDFAADATMGPDAAASNTTYYSDGTHPTNAGQVLLEVVYRAVMNAM